MPAKQNQWPAPVQLPDGGFEYELPSSDEEDFRPWKFRAAWTAMRLPDWFGMGLDSVEAADFELMNTGGHGNRTAADGALETGTNVTAGKELDSSGKQAVVAHGVGLQHAFADDRVSAAAWGEGCLQHGTYSTAGHLGHATERADRAVHDAEHNETAKANVCKAPSTMAVHKEAAEVKEAARQVVLMGPAAEVASKQEEAEAAASGAGTRVPATKATAAVAADKRATEPATGKAAAAVARPKKAVETAKCKAAAEQAVPVAAAGTDAPRQVAHGVGQPKHRKGQLGAAGCNGAGGVQQTMELVCSQQPLQHWLAPAGDGSAGCRQWVIAGEIGTCEMQPLQCINVQHSSAGNDCSVGQSQQSNVRLDWVDCTAAGCANLQPNGGGGNMLQQCEVQFGSAEHISAGSGVQPVGPACGMERTPHDSVPFGLAESIGAGRARRPPDVACEQEQLQQCKWQLSSAGDGGCVDCNQQMLSESDTAEHTGMQKTSEHVRGMGQPRNAVAKLSMFKGTKDSRGQSERHGGVGAGSVRPLQRCDVRNDTRHGVGRLQLFKGNTGRAGPGAGTSMLSAAMQQGHVNMYAAHSLTVLDKTV
jgi:hypothetical protein